MLVKEVRLVSPESGQLGHTVLGRFFHSSVPKAHVRCPPCTRRLGAELGECLEGTDNAHMIQG